LPGLRILLVVATFGLAATGLSACGASKSVATHARPTTLTAGQSAQLARDERAWTTAQKRWAAITGRCLSATSASATTSCRPRVRSSYARWKALFARARRDVSADAGTLGGSRSPTVHTCESRLLHYLGGIEVGRPLIHDMSYAELSVQDGLNEISLSTYDSRSVVSAARAAEAACSP
jgi:hypothetical protein